MNLLRILVLSILVIFTDPGISFGQVGDGGGTGLAFLKLGVGARASGLGEAYSSVADDATATYWNPAGLALLDGTQLAFSHTEWIQGISNDFLAFAFPGLGGTVGLSFYSNNVNGIERRELPSPQPSGTVDANDIALGLSFGHSISSALTVGATVKYLYEKISLEGAAGYAFDFGANYTPFDPPLNFSVVLHNIGSMGELLNESIELPRTFRIGVSYLHELTSLEGAILLAAEGVKVSENEVRGNFGAEFQFKNRLALRLGYQTGFDEKSLGGGFGMNFDRYHLDYGFTPFSSNFGDTHRFSFGLDL